MSTPGVTLTATLQDASGSPVQGRVVLTLVNYGSTVPAVAGTMTFANLSYTGVANASGQVSITIFGNYQLNVPNSFYQVQVFGTDSNGVVNGAANLTGAYQFSAGGTFDLSSLAPISTYSGVTVINPLTAIVTNPAGTQSIAGFGLVLPNVVSSSVQAAGSGFVRLAKGDAIAFRNNANSADLILAKNTSDNLTWPNGAVFGGSITVQSVENAQYVDSTLSRGGIDIGDEINKAYAAGASNGVHIRVAPGVYNFTTPIVFGTPLKPVYLEGAPGVSGNFTTNPSTTQLNFTPTGGAFPANIAMTVANGSGTTIRGISLQGSGTGNPTIGLLVGGQTNATSAINTRYESIDIGAFGTGLVFGFNSYINTFLNMTIHDNGVNVASPATLNSVTVTGTTENTSFIGGSISNKGSAFSATCINIQQGGDWHFSGVSIDQCGFTSNGPNVFVDFHSVHMENPGGTTTTPFFTFGAACNVCTLNNYGGLWLEDGTAGARTSFIVDNSTVANHALQVNIFGGTFAPGETVGQIFLGGQGAGGSCCAQGFSSLYNNGIGGSTFTTTFGGNMYAAIDLQDSVKEGGINFGNPGKMLTLDPTALTASRTIAFPDNSGKLPATTNMLISNTAPTVSSGFNTGSVAGSNGTASFVVSVGTGTAGSTGVIALPAANGFWNCFASNFSRAAYIAQTGTSSTSATLTNFGTTFVATNWTNSDSIIVSCFAR